MRDGQAEKTSRYASQDPVGWMSKRGEREDKDGCKGESHANLPL